MPFSTRYDGAVEILSRFGIAVALLLVGAAPMRAQEPAQIPSTPVPSTAPAPEAQKTDGAATAEDKAADSETGVDPDSKNRIFGVMPNYTTVEGFGAVKPITGGESFKMAALDSFDPFVYPLFGFIAGISHAQNDPPEWGQTWSGYAKRYGLAFADNTVCSLVTTGLMPTLLKQDPRYYQGRATGFVHRFYYAASRSAVTKSRTGHPQFNLSEIGGTLIVANISNLYYPASERTVPDTLTRWGTQTMWDTVANELKEFWPDIRKALHRF